MPYSITREDAARDLRALRAVLSGFPVGISSSAIPALQELADSIEEQVKPDEPTEWGSVVRARFSDDEDDTALLAYVPNPEESDPDRPQGFPWYSDQDSWHAWSDLTVVEVIRIGAGEAAAPVDADEFMVSAGFTPRPSEFDRANMADESARLDAANADNDAYQQGIKDERDRLKQSEYRCAGGCILSSPHEGRACEIRGHSSPKTDVGAGALPDPISPGSGVATSSPAPTSPRFCSLTANCRMADGHTGGCRP